MTRHSRYQTITREARVKTDRRAWTERREVEAEAKARSRWFQEEITIPIPLSGHWAVATLTYRVGRKRSKRVVLRALMLVFVFLTEDGSNRGKGKMETDGGWGRRVRATSARMCRWDN